MSFSDEAWRDLMGRRAWARDLEEQRAKLAEILVREGRALVLEFEVLEKGRYRFLVVHPGFETRLTRQGIGAIPFLEAFWSLTSEFRPHTSKSPPTQLLRG